MERCLICENGIPVYADTNPHLHGIQLSLYIRCGVLYEDGAYGGITHFFEHIVFRNIDRLTNGNFYSELDRHAVDFNASTYKEFMCFDLSFAPGSAGFVTEIFRNIFAGIVLSPHEIAVERSVVAAEANEDDEKNTVEYHAVRKIWAGTVLEQTVIGSKTKLRRIGADKLNRFRRELFSSGDLFVYVTGSAGEDLLQKISAAVSAVGLPLAARRRYNIAPVPENFGKRNCDISVFKSDYTRVMLCFDFYRSEALCAEISLLYDVLFRGEACRFRDELITRLGLIYSYSTTLEEYANIGNLRVSFDVAPENLEKALTQIVRILNAVKDGESDLTKCRALCRRSLETKLDHPDELNWDNAYYNHIEDESFTNEQRQQRYLETDAHRLAEIAESIFSTDRLIVVLKREKPGVSVGKIGRIMRGLDRLCPAPADGCAGENKSSAVKREAENKMPPGTAADKKERRKQVGVQI